MHLLIQGGKVCVCLFFFIHVTVFLSAVYSFEGKAKYIFPSSANKMIVLWLKLLNIFQTRAGKLFVLNRLAVFCYVKQMPSFATHL